MAEWRFDGFPGRLLVIDLTSGESKTIHLPEIDLRENLGGKLLALHLLCEYDTTDYQEAYSHLDPVSGKPNPAFHPTSPIIFATGPLQASGIFSTGRTCAMFRSPLTGLIHDSYGGGEFGNQLRLAGWDAMMVTGRAAKLTRIEVVNEEVRIIPATEMVGMAVRECEESVRGMRGGITDAYSTLTIGPAGESKVRMANIISQSRRAFGRGGAGAVFGSKNLKSVLVSGTGSPKVADSATLESAIDKQRNAQTQKRREKDPLYLFGTSMAPKYAAVTDRLPTRNYTSADGMILGSEQSLQVEKLCGNHWSEVVDNPKQSSCCKPCIIACEGRGILSMHGLKGKGRQGDRPEYETLSLLGSNLGIDEVEDVMLANDVANDVGIDTISGGAAISLLCELVEKQEFPVELAEGWMDNELEGYISSSSVIQNNSKIPCVKSPTNFARFSKGDLVPLIFGLPELAPVMLKRLSESVKSPFFEALSLGAVGFGEWLEKSYGINVTKYTAHCKGLDLPAWDPRGKRGSALAYMTSDVGASHMRGDYKGSTGIPDKSALDLVPEIIEAQNRSVLRDSMIFCAFATSTIPDELIEEAWRSLTGEDASLTTLLRRAGKAWDVSRQFQVSHWKRVGLDIPIQDLLSNRLRNERLPSGSAEGCVGFVDEEDEAACLAEYWKLRGWDKDGCPLSLCSKE